MIITVDSGDVVMIVTVVNTSESPTGYSRVVRCVEFDVIRGKPT